MIGSLLTGVGWFDALALIGFVVLAALVFGIPVWMFASRIHWRREDAREMSRLLDRTGLTDTNTIPKHRTKKEASAA
jgi:hypothetical protein